MAGGGYVVYEEHLPTMQRAVEARCYWQGPESRAWGGGAASRETAARFPDQHAARAELLRSGDTGAGWRDLSQVGYEWVPGDVEQPELFLLAAEAAR